MGLKEFGGGDEGKEEGHGRELFGAFNVRREVGDVGGEGKLDDVGGGFGQRMGNEREVTGSGEEGEGGEMMGMDDVGKMKERDGVTFRQEWKDYYVRQWRTWFHFVFALYRADDLVCSF